MEFQTAKKWFVPYGIWIVLSHSEACELTSGKSVSAITTAIGAIGTIYAAIAAAAISLQAKYIREKNESSGGKGVKLLFVWALGVITSINRRGSGSSPC
jgi:hypothetical protein